MPRFVLPLIALAVLAACSPAPREAPPGQAASTSPAAPASAPAERHLRADGTRFVRGDGSPFDWRGISAFRLAEQIAHGRAAEAEAFLDWAASQKLTVVRVFAMARHLFELSPEDGRAALPKLLDLAAARGVHVEIVALADTAAIQTDIGAQVAAIGEIAATHPNALIEVANEPVHPTQHPDVHKVEVIATAAARVPEAVPVALGSVERGDGFAGGDYVTWHSPREDAPAGWGHVLALAEGAALASRWKKPIVSDEPIGAAAQHIPGRRDDTPARFAAAAALTRFAGASPTFHHEGGLQARIPAARELECFEGWKAGVELVSRVPADAGALMSGDAVGAIADRSGARAAFARQAANGVWLLLIDPAPGEVQWREGWTQDGDWQVPGARLLRARRP